MSKPNAKLSNLTDGFRSAMLVTHDQDGSLRARPMALAEVEDPKVLWFATLQTSGKVDELRDDSRVAVTLQGSKRQVSLTGRAEVVIDADKIDAIGVRGLERCAAYARERGVRGPLNVAREVAEHCDEKLLRLRDEYVRTAPGKRRAAPGHEWLAAWRERARGVVGF